MIIKNGKSLLNTHLFIIVLFSLIFSSCEQGSKHESAYLFTYFTGNGPGEEQVRYAISDDGYHFFALNNNEPILDSKEISNSGGVRDPHVLRGQDGKFYMVVTDLYVPEMGWENTAMVLMKSDDLINWTHSVIDIKEAYPESFGDVKRVWAPQTIYDIKAGKYMLYWSMLKSEGPDIIYYAYANEDFTGLESEPQLLFRSPDDFATIDGDIIEKEGEFNLFYKSAGDGGGIRKAVSDELTQGYKRQEGFYDLTDEAVEGSGIFKIIGTDEYILMYDVYSKGKYQFTKSKDLENFEIVDEQISMNFHPRHGSIIPITESEKNALIEKWGKIGEGSLLTIDNKMAKPNNVVINDEESTIYIPVDRGTDFTNFNPGFNLVPWVKLTEPKSWDFSNGPIDVQLKSGNESKTYKVEASQDNNPALKGYYADPEIIYSEKNKKYYLYPTSDGFTGWSGTYFKTFSSENLVDWKDEGVILDVKKDVEWADRNAWAPTAIERKIGEDYKYFYYFTAAQKIGVAVANDPAGPFVDSGKPLIASRPAGPEWGQEIDPDVFHDPVTDKYYLFWGNGYMARAELNDDMISIKPNSVELITPNPTFREGAEVFYRNGRYYFLWSEDDTRSPNYRVRYAYSEAADGTLTIPENNLVIEKKPEEGIYGTGHNSVIKIDGKDEWYIVYHRFNRPHGIDLGDAAGFNREVCIDRLNFDEKGNIIQVVPTVGGIH